MSSRRSRNIQPDADTKQTNNGNAYNSGNTNNNRNSGGQSNMNLGQLLNNLDLNQIMGQLSQMAGGPGGGSQAPRPQIPNDPRISLLQAMKPFLNTRRSTMIDRIAQFYSILKIVQGQNKRR